MSKLIRACISASLFAAILLSTGCKTEKPQAEMSSAAVPPPADPCAFPTVMAATPEQTAWQLFVAANCPSNNSKVVWENWVEQSQLYPASGTSGISAAAVTPAKRLHGSPLASILAQKQGLSAKLLATPGGCNKMGGPPKNVVPNATICEEARLNPTAEGFIKNAGYGIRSGQITAAQQGTDIEFSPPAVEIKVDWIPATDFNPLFGCSEPPPGIYVEEIDGVCYALGGMHISSKLLGNWLWATFEPQSMLTNTLRCITFGACNDPWGSDPAMSSGGPDGFTKQTPAVATLMQQAKLAPAFANYRLDRAQVNFTLPDGSPDLLGNSVIEGENVGLKAGQASCITCHSLSSVNKKGVDGSTLFKTAKTVGPKIVLPEGFIARDFVWSMGLACPGSGLRTAGDPCKAAAASK